MKSKSRNTSNAACCKARRRRQEEERGMRVCVRAGLFISLIGGFLLLAASAASAASTAWYDAYRKGITIAEARLYAQAEPQLNKALAIRQTALGEADPHVAESLRVLASLYYSQGRDQDGDALWQRAHALDEQRAQ
jgi:hypothetical protein